MINQPKAKAQGVTGVKYTKSPEKAEMINLVKKNIYINILLWAPR